ncbi:MAG: hypothetical protein ABIL58_27455 [Pseudomonadota bacterium]
MLYEQTPAIRFPMTALIVLLKIGVTLAMVVALSVVAEHVSPRVAGVLSGYPLGSAIALFFIGLEIGPGFAADSAVYTTAGLVGTLCFVYVYYRTAVRCRRWEIAAASAAATGGYAAAIGLLQTVHLTKPMAVVLPVVATVAFAVLFRRIPDSRIDRPVRLTFRVLVLRAALATLILLAVTGAAHWVGPRWAGLFSAFPTTLFPLILIIHVSYGRNHVYTIVKNFPRGLGALICYTLVVSLAYPALGLYVGTAAAFAAATGYLVSFAVLVVYRERRLSAWGRTGSLKNRFVRR